MQTTHTGWRELSPAVIARAEILIDVDKDALFRCVRLAAKGLRLRTGARYILEQLVGCYGGEPIEGRLLVWPSNVYLSERTGISERAVRYALKNLIELGLITPKDSANGKRFARRSLSGQIIAAFGFDLGQLFSRLEEFEQRVAAAKELKKARSEQFDEITIARRATREAINSLTEWFPTVDIQSILERFEALTASLPRRQSNQPLEGVIASWQLLRQDTEALYITASGGNNSRHKEHNNDADQHSCNKGAENGLAKIEKSEVTFEDLKRACPDAFGYWTPVHTEIDLIRAAGSLRGTLGAHESAWTEACEKIGGVAAATAFFIVLQNYIRDQRTGGSIKNPGGYFRAYIRKVAAGNIDLQAEIVTLNRRRMN